MNPPDRRLQEARERLMSANERDEFLRIYGEAARPILEDMLIAAATKLLAGYEAAWSKIINEIVRAAPDADECRLLTDEEASTLLAIPAAAVRRLKATGKEQELTDRLLSHADAAKKLGCSVATVKRLVKAGELPQPIQISEKRIGHRLSDLTSFIARRGKTAD